MHSIAVKLVSTSGFFPEYKTAGAAGVDLVSSETLDIAAGASVLVPTGVFIEIPDGFEGQVRPRSGLAIKHGVTVLNSPGTIDSDYRGEIKVILINHGRSDFHIEKGDRIAQLIFCSVVKAEFEIVSVLSDTDRGEGGFGHTGV